MCTVLLPPGVNPIAVKYIISYIISYITHVHCKLYYPAKRLAVAVVKFRPKTVVLFT